MKESTSGKAGWDGVVWMWLVVLVLLARPAYVQRCAGGESPRNVLIITAHPDDLEIGMGGTAYLLKDKYKIHVAIASRGERGLSKEPDPNTAALRTHHAELTAEMLGAKVHFLGQIDGEIYADKAAVEKVVGLLKELDPAIVFVMWPIDKPDHTAASATALMALSKTGMMHDREVYFFEVGRGGTTNGFEPDVYVDISAVHEQKAKMVAIHELQADGRLGEMADTSDSEHGRMNRCRYAEAFKPLYPFTNNRWNKKTRCTLMDLQNN
jgi:LmbE family N-acetylglucosaminyl deacetylase